MYAWLCTMYKENSAVTVFTFGGLTYYTIHPDMYTHVQEVKTVA